MAAMQTAAKSLVDQLSALAKTNGDVYISIVPFAKDVNVGASNYKQSTGSIAAIGTRPTATCSTARNSQGSS